MANVNQGVALSQINLTASSDNVGQNEPPRARPQGHSVLVERVSSNARGPPPEPPKMTFKDTLIEFLSQKVQVSYLIAISALIGGCILLISVGLGAGLGSQKHCRSLELSSHHQGSKRSDDSSSEVTKRSVKPEPGKPWTNYRLPRSIIPIHYTVDLRPYFYNDRDKWFKVRVKIEATVTEATRYVIFHANAINVTSTSVKYAPLEDGNDNQQADLGIERTFRFAPFNYYVVVLNSKLRANRNISIEVTARGSLANTFEGFYKSSFNLPGSDEKLYAAMTQFEPLAARKAFPCFDEPNMKAYFTIIIRHKPSVIAFSNMPLETKQTGQDSEGLTMTSVFRRTNVVLSTYLVAWVIGPYTSSVCKATSTNLPVCVYSPKHLAGQIQYSLDTAVTGVEWLQSYFGFNYPLPKLDMIVLPEFRSSAMENWGLVTYKEEALLVSDDNTDVDTDRVTGVVMHELAHQWFGNLVTMDWWDDLWLNEGFASYMEYPSNMAMGHLFKGKDFSKFLEAITRDGAESTRQIRVVNVKTGDDISSAFDAVTYRKGASIIRMLVSAIGADSFREGVRHYMRKLQFGNSKTSDLWASLSRFSSVDIKATMDSWVEQKGYPVVTIDQANSGNTLVLRQERFVLPQWRPKSDDSESWTDEEQASDDGSQNGFWHIPIMYKQKGVENATIKWFPASGSPFEISFSPSVSTNELKLNWEQTAYIRVNYPLETWEQFAIMLSDDINVFGSVDRAGLVDDSLELAKAGRLSYLVVLNLLRFMAKETDPIVWEAFHGQVVFLRYMLADSTYSRLFDDYVLGLIRAARVRTNKLPDSTASTKMRTLTTLSDLSLVFKRKEEISCYAEYYRSDLWQQPPNHNLRKAILLAYLLSNDTEQTFKRFQSLSRQSSVKQVKNSFQNALANTQNNWLIVRELQKVFSGELRPPEFISFASQASASPQRRQFIWTWVRENFDKLIPIFGGKTRNIMRWVADLGSYFTTKAQYKEFSDFVKSVGSFGAGERPKDLAMERMRMNIYWRANFRQDLESALSAQEEAINAAIENTPVSC